MPGNPNERLHALDNLRAILMWLGIVIHVAGNYLVRIDSPLPWKDPRGSPLADLAVTVIHAFRMPAFFIVAGFFCALLVQGRGVRGMVKNRLMRLGLPFLVFWPVVYVACGFAALAYFHLMVRGTWGLDASLVPRKSPTGPNTIHMWFLWMLLWMCLATAALHRLPHEWFRKPGEWLLALGRSPWGIAVLALPMTIAGMQYPRGALHVSGFLIPPWAEWLHHVPYFAFGFVMYFHRQELFALYRARIGPYAWAGLAAFIVTGVAHERGGPDWLFAFAYACAGWFWSFALIGFALTRMASRHPALGYLADSSYWVYLLHMPLTIFFGAALYTADLPGAVKMLLGIVATTAVCLVTYHLFVRRSWVSVLLNGRRHGAPQPAMVPAA